MPFFDEIKYIFVGRDGKDVWMSMWNHWHNMNPDVINDMNNAPDREGPALVHPPQDIGPAFDEWLIRSTFPWENDGYPFWSHLYHARSWRAYRHMPNILMVHFDDLLRDIDGKCGVSLIIWVLRLMKKSGRACWKVFPSSP
ncbi:MAG TPA: hypothetical protein DCM64_11860 [Gammaproteobacteria bacterium]|nr:hypothetical protein [Gammaproteobacteria bacterium]